MQSTHSLAATLVAFHGDPAIKRKYLSRVRAHARADRLVKGTGWENGKGCAVGCTLEAKGNSRQVKRVKP